MINNNNFIPYLKEYLPDFIFINNQNKLNEKVCKIFLAVVFGIIAGFTHLSSFGIVLLLGSFALMYNVFKNNVIDVDA